MANLDNENLMEKSTARSSKAMEEEPPSPKREFEITGLEIVPSDGTWEQAYKKRRYTNEIPTFEIISQKSPWKTNTNLRTPNVGRQERKRPSET